MELFAAMVLYPSGITLSNHINKDAFSQDPLKNIRLFPKSVVVTSLILALCSELFFYHLEYALYFPAGYYLNIIFQWTGHFK